MEWLENVKLWFEQYPWIFQMLMALAIILVSYIAYRLTNKYVVMLLQKIAKKSKTQFDDAIIESRLINRLSYFIPLLMIINLAFLFPEVEEWIQRIASLIMIFISMRAIEAFLYAVNNYYETLPRSKERPIKSYIQIVIILVYIFSIVFMIGLLTGQSPWVLVSGLGALTAVILLIFRDTILSFVSGMQITSYGLVHVGDWIEMPQYGADGDVVEIALHTVKVQNWDKTYTIIPTHKLTSDAFKNWRGMKQAGGRRIKRAIYFDQNSVKFCDDTMMHKFEDILLLSDYMKQKKEELALFNEEHHLEDNHQIHRRRLTNIGTFRIYVEKYIENHPKIKQNLTHMVRQLQPGPNGLPMEIYCFTNDTAWKNYEAIQSDIFDHLLAVVQEFDLRIFQNPSGKDFSSIVK
ncbi:MAG: mechanosensitive ion channel [Calditrichaceae bacterium]